MIEFKNEKDKMLFSLLHPAIIMIYSDLYLYAKEKHNVNIVVTQTISDKEQDQALNRVSDSHRTGRAIDIRTKNLDITIINDLVEYINTRWVYKKYHYTARSGVKRLAYYHVGSAEHIHLAIGAQFSQNINIAGL